MNRRKESVACKCHRFFLRVFRGSLAGRPQVEPNSKSTFCGRLDSLKVVEQHPALVVPHADVAPCAERLANLHFCPLVNGEEVSAGAVGRGLGIYHTLRDDGLGAGSVAAVERGGIRTAPDTKQQGNPADVECRLAENGRMPEQEHHRPRKEEHKQSDT